MAHWMSVSISGGMVAEKSEVWRSRGQRSTMRRTSGRKPMSSMRSASSSTRNLTWSSRQVPCCIMVEQPAGRGDQHIHAVAQGVRLLAVADAAEDHGDAQVGEAGEIVDGGFDLGGQFAGRLEDQHARLRARAGRAGKGWAARRRRSCRCRSGRCRSRPGRPGSAEWRGVEWGSARRSPWPCTPSSNWVRQTNLLNAITYANCAVADARRANLTLNGDVSERALRPARVHGTRVDGGDSADLIRARAAVSPARRGGSLSGAGRQLAAGASAV